jgi:predicted secreted protein
MTGQLFDINERPGVDKCSVVAEDVANAKILGYTFTDAADAAVGDLVRYSSDHVNLRFGVGMGGPSQREIDVDSLLKNGMGWNPRGRSQLHARTFAANADLTGGTVDSAAGEAELVRAVATTDRATALSGVHIDRFQPMLPSLRRTVQDPDHIVPTSWVRGGEDTREATRSFAYVASQGYKQDGPSGAWTAAGN